MKLKEGFVCHKVDGQHMVVATGDLAKKFNGMIRNNSTADFIYQMLMEETTEEKIIDEMVKKYDVSRKIVEKDVREVIDKIRKAGFLDE